MNPNLEIHLESSRDGSTASGGIHGGIPNVWGLAKDLHLGGSGSSVGRFETMGTGGFGALGVALCTSACLFASSVSSPSPLFAPAPLSLHNARTETHGHTSRLRQGRR